MKPAPRLRGETRALEVAARSTAPGSFLQLTDGCTHFELAGAPGRPTVVLIHGFTVPYFVWDPTYGTLVDSGIRTLRYDLFGRGYSDRPDADYDIDLFCRQLEDLLDALNASSVALVGLSMGGPIAASFAVRHPHRVQRMVLIDPSGAGGMALGLFYRLATLPLVGEVLMGLFGTEQLAGLVAGDFYDSSEVELFKRRFLLQMEFAGFKHAILSTVRQGMLGDFTDTYARLGQSNIPVLLLWGRHDRTVPFSGSRRLLRLLPYAEFHPIENAGHIPHFEQPELVNPLLLDFLMSKNEKHS
jgi:pimeloyl-ACP methyl ester carboxylesterase